MSADADRIEELLAALEECADNRAAERAAHERTKAELADERQTLASVRYTRDMALEQRDAAQAELARVQADNRTLLKALARIAAGNVVKGGPEMTNARMMRIARAVLLDLRGTKPLVSVEAEIDEERALLERLQKAESEAAAMREALEGVLDFLVTPCAGGDDAILLDRRVTESRKALDGNAGRALAARVTLWRELESIMRTDGNIGLIDKVIAKLVALDEKGGGS